MRNYYTNNTPMPHAIPLTPLLPPAFPARGVEEIEIVGYREAPHTGELRPVKILVKRPAATSNPAATKTSLDWRSFLCGLAVGAALVALGVLL
jgi:hypothetical protein